MSVNKILPTTIIRDNSDICYKSWLEYLEGDDLKASNTAQEPDKVTPVEKQLGEKVVLAPKSWNMILMEG